MNDPLIDLIQGPQPPANQGQDPLLSLLGVPPAPTQQPATVDTSQATQSRPLGPPEPMSWAETQLSKLPSSGSTVDYIVNRLRGAAIGASDPIIGLLQTGAHTYGLPVADKLDQAIADKNAAYESDRSSVGASGFDFARLLGGVGGTLPALKSVSAPKTALSALLQGTGIGSALGVASPVNSVPTDSSYAEEKGKQVGLSALSGGLASPLTYGLSKVIAPQANKAWDAIKSAGVDTTIGQRLGGMFNSLEEKATSFLPIVGDVISKARQRALQSWNQATFNDVVAPVGGKVTETGHSGMAQAGDILSSTYNSVLGQIKGVKFDPQFASELGELKAGAQNLTPDMANRFANIVDREFASRLSQVGSMDAETLKKASSSISMYARKFGGSSAASEQELGGALHELDSLINKQIARANPQYAEMLDSVDLGWAKLVRVEAAMRAAAGNKLNTETFTPSQLLSAVRNADQSVRGRATARGESLMQDWAQNGMKVLGDKVPNSGTMDRASNGALAVALMAHPELLVPAGAGIAAGSALYTAPAQKAMVGIANLAAKRPEQAKALADLVRKSSPLAPVAGNALLDGSQQ